MLAGRRGPLFRLGWPVCNILRLRGLRRCNWGRRGSSQAVIPAIHDVGRGVPASVFFETRTVAVNDHSGNVQQRQLQIGMSDAFCVHIDGGDVKLLLVIDALVFSSSASAMTIAPEPQAGSTRSKTRARDAPLKSSLSPTIIFAMARQSGNGVKYWPLHLLWSSSS